MKLPRLHLYIFHYHLLSGGVTDVIMGWLRILAEYSQNIFPQYRQIALHVCCGRPDNVANLQKQWQEFRRVRLSAALQQRLADVNFVVDEELDYKADEPCERQDRVENLAAHLLRRYAPEGQEALWWIHNYHIGKNVAYTEALLQIIENHQPPSLRFLLHIHDFPECGRSSRYHALLQAQKQRRTRATKNNEPEAISENTELPKLYPQKENLCYAVINRRDYQILRAAGLQNLFFLPNPLNLAQPETAASFAVGSSRGEEPLRSAFGRAFGLAEKTLALYPVRCIRRKNVLELGLLNLLAGELWNLVCTLPGLSKAEKSYSRLVETLFAEGVLCGLFGVGLRLEQRGWSFEMLCRAADWIVSSSVLEGFGFAYFQPMLWGKFLLARKLDILEGFRACFAPELTCFYDELKIPLHSSAFPLAESYRELRERYCAYFAALPARAGSALQKELAASLPPKPPENLDFAVFPVEMQCRILRHLQQNRQNAPGSDAAFSSRSPFLRECKQANQPLLKELERFQQQLVRLEGAADKCGNRGKNDGDLLQKARRRSRTEIERTFAPQRLAELLQQACNSNAGAKPEKIYAQKPGQSRIVVEAFSRLEYNYALLWEDTDYSGM